MFDDIKDNEGENTPGNNKPEDIFDNTEGQELGEVSSEPPSVSGVSAPPIDEPTEAIEYEEPKKSPIIKIILIVVVVVIVGIGGYLGWQYFSQDKVEVLEDLTADEPMTSSDETEPGTPSYPQDNNNIVEEGKDTDNDGLLDTEEIQYGTSIEMPDTDEDGLFDREEVKVYNTNPTVADSDGDGFDDGTEVRAGYNPNGEGELLPETPTQ